MNYNDYDPKTVELIEKVFEQKRNMTEGVFRTLSQLKKVAYEKEDYALQGFAHFHIADSMFTFEKGWDKFRKNMAKALYFFQMADEKLLLARTYNYVAVDALNNGSFDVAYLYLMNALQTCEDLDDYYILSIVNNNIGQVYARMHSHKKAIKYMRDSMKLQAKGAKDDFYYHQNMINGYFSLGVMCSLMGDVKGAKNADRKIIELEKEIDLADNPSVFNPISLLRLMISILEGDEEKTENYSQEIVRTLRDAHGIYDFMTDIEDLCNFLIEHDRIETVGEILKIMKKTVDDTSVIQMKKVFSSMEIAYYEKMGDVEKVNEHLHEQYELVMLQQDEQNRIYQYSIDLINIMEEQRKENEKVRLENEVLQSQAMTDPLTGIPNRLKLDQDIPKVFEATMKEGLSFGVSLMDIDKFKTYNDTYGHLAGDICLQKVAKTIQEVSDRPGVHCARYGGDEFIMLYENKTDEEVMSIARELSEKIRKLDIAHSGMGKNGRVSVSQGICNCTSGEDHDQEDFLSEADNALYAVKKNLDIPGKKETIRLTHL